MRPARLIPSLLVACVACLPALPASADPFENKAVELASELASNPAAFFFDFQQDQESTNPLPPTKGLGLNWHFGQFIPIIPPYLIIPIPDPTILNLSAKVKVFRENGLFPGMPQLDAIGGFWTAGPFLKKAVEEDALTCDDPDCVGEPYPDPGNKLKDAQFNGRFMGVVLTSSLEPRVRLYWGFKQSQMKAEATLNKPIDIQGSNVKSFSSEYKDKFLFAGLEHPTGPNKFWLLQMSYGLDNRSLMGKVSWYRKYLELSLNIYPEGVFVIHPSLNFHFNFW